LPASLTDKLRRHTEFLRFCVVGASGVAVNLAVFSATLWLVRRWVATDVVADTVAVAMGWLVAVASNFAFNDRWTFGQRSPSAADPWPARLGRYYLGAALGLAVQYAVFRSVMAVLGDLSWLPHAIAAWHRHLANLCGIAVATVSNYLVSRRLVFRMPH
jgi:putative flippase GtrA